MKCFGLFLLPFILCSCGQHTQIHEDIKDINANIASLEKTLPENCKTAQIEKQIANIKARTQQVEIRYEAQVEVLTNEKIKWKTLFFCLSFVIMIYIAGRFIK